MNSNFDYIFIKIYIKVLAGLTLLCSIVIFVFFPFFSFSQWLRQCDPKMNVLDSA